MGPVHLVVVERRDPVVVHVTVRHLPGPLGIVVTNAEDIGDDGWRLLALHFAVAGPIALDVLGARLPG